MPTVRKASADARRQVGEVQGAGHQVQQADADDDEGRADGAHDQVLVGRIQRAPVAAQCDQDVGRQRRDLEEHEHVERIAGDGHAEQPAEAQQVRGPEQVVQVARYFLRDAFARVGRHQRAGRGDDDQHECAGRVDAILDAPGHRPAAHQVGDGAGLVDAQQQRHRDREHGPARGERHGPRRVGPPQQHAQRRRDQRHHDLQRRQLLRDHSASRSIAWISSSSMLPKASWMRTTRASPSAMVATPTTIAVRISTCGSGLE
jgi:hypothetical protein